jgi:chemotaxis protein MotB
MMRRWIGALCVLAASSLAGCASDWQERYEQSQRENLDIAQQMEALRTQQAQDAAKTEAALGQVSALDRENQKLMEERNRAAQVALDWQKRAEQQPTAGRPAAPATGDEIDRKVRELQNAGYTTHRTADGDIEITLASDVTFGSGSDVLAEGAKKSLKALAPKLNGEFAQYMIRVEGHTDNEPLNRTKGKYGDNLGLSTARANSVSRFMQDEMRIDPKRVMSAGRGDQKPIADNRTPAGKAKNRRVEIVVVTGVQAK